jgi:ABC-2 type transport system ATP-binding protein
MSLAQLGLTLHVLVDRSVAGAPDRVSQALRNAGVDAHVEATHANLEDVFVAATLPHTKANERSAA